MELVVQFPTRGSTQVLLCLFPGVLWLGHFLYSFCPHSVSSLHIYTSLRRGHSWRVRLAKQETPTPPGTWSRLSFAEVRECRPWCSIVGARVTVHQFFCILHCKYISQNISILKVVTFNSIMSIMKMKKLKMI